MSFLALNRMHGHVNCQNVRHVPFVGLVGNSSRSCNSQQRSYSQHLEPGRDHSLNQSPNQAPIKASIRFQSMPNQS